MNLNFKGKTALVGDYIEGSYNNTIKVLQSFGIKVDVVNSGQDILEKIKYNTQKYDIIFTNNIYKQGIDGPTTLYMLRKIEEFNTPVVIHTVSEELKDYFINSCGFDGYILKPLTQKKVEPILTKFLSNHK